MANSIRGDKMMSDNGQWEVVLWFDNDRCETTNYWTRGEADEYAHDNMARCRSVEIYGPDHYDSCQC